MRRLTYQEPLANMNNPINDIQAFKVELKLHIINLIEKKLTGKESMQKRHYCLWFHLRMTEKTSKRDGQDDVSYIKASAFWQSTKAFNHRTSLRLMLTAS